MNQPGHKNVHLLSKPKPSLLENSQVPKERCGMARWPGKEYVFGDGCAVCDSGEMVCERTGCSITFKAIHVSLGRNRKYNTVRLPNTGNKPKAPNQCNSQPKPKPKKRQPGYITAFCLLKYQSQMSPFPKITPSISLAADDIYSARIFLSFFLLFESGSTCCHHRL